MELLIRHLSALSLNASHNLRPQRVSTSWSNLLQRSFSRVFYLKSHGLLSGIDTLANIYTNGSHFKQCFQNTSYMNKRYVPSYVNIQNA